MDSEESPKATSARMRAVRQQDTGAEVRLRRALWQKGLRYRKQVRVAGTKPDIVFGGARVAIFVDGCFWHGCPQHYVAPVRNSAFWRAKLERNQARDMRDTLRLLEADWSVLRFWECEIDDELDRVVQDVIVAVRGTTASSGSFADGAETLPLPSRID